MVFKISCCISIGLKYMLARPYFLRCGLSLVFCLKRFYAHGVFAPMIKKSGLSHLFYFLHIRPIKCDNYTATFFLYRL